MDSDQEEVKQDQEVEFDDDNTIRILIATDIHMGFLETDKERGNDSFVTYEEILEHALDQEVDMVLLGGDLFHVNKPSPTSMKKCLEIMRKYCIGSKPVYIDLISDPKLTMVSENVNFLDPNLNISLPVFSINGNHDDPSGPELVAALDIISNTGLVNYFGKCITLTEITLSPLIFQKGETKIAIFGLGYIKDERLAHMIKYNKVKYLKPDKDEGMIYILVLHQNRPERGTVKHVSEDNIPDFFHFILWGHEHECRIKPEYNLKKRFHVCQPGSPVATSLCEGEAVKKKYGVLLCNKSNYQLASHDLETVRPFVFRKMLIEQHEFDEDIEHKITAAVEDMIEEAKTQLSGNPKQPKLPLIRLRIESCKPDSLSINPIVFGQKYENKVANSNEMLLIKIRRFKSDMTDKNMVGDIDQEENQIYIDDCVEDLLSSYYEQAAPEYQLQGFLPGELNESVKRFISQDDRCVFSDMIDYKMETIMKHFESANIQEEEIDLELTNFQSTIAEDQGKEFKTYLASQKRTQSTTRAFDLDPDDILMLSSDEESNTTTESVSRPPRGRGTRGGRGSRGPRGSRARGKK